MNQYQSPIQGFQPELSNVPVSTSGESSTAKFFKVLVKIILIIGAIILILPLVAAVICLAIYFILTLPLINVIGVGTILFTGFTIIINNNNKRISKKYLPLLIFAIIFSLLFLAGQYDVQSFNCLLH